MPVSPPRPKGPPLNALRAFEAAARLGGFAAAADELSVTPGAIAQHVKSLEAWAGTDLFERRSQGIALTRLGAQVIEKLSLAFDQLGNAVQSLRALAAPGHISIAALPCIAQLWLSPRLPAIRSALPHIGISITALEQMPNLQREPFDLCIFYQTLPIDPGAIILCDDDIYPVCTPAIAHTLKSPTDIGNAVCLHDSTWSSDWALWLESACPDVAVQTKGPVFSLYSLALEEARNGAGVLIGHDALVRPHLESGALVAPFATRRRLNRALTITRSRVLRDNPVLQQVVELLQA
ncbi:LysR family transcriptional regulator [Thalassospira sp.]|uniref:LysR family transcriptional regulator n=1 Tax=Thalassospira sp. TaxID=1912094 RepID=UPI00273606C4|nr:LysR family transcriptional regulator [Thalassospira sp.]MDP2697182.1 LysR family transcriptional regulator [Thalassospira sp.]